MKTINKAKQLNDKAKEIEEALECSKDEALKLLGLIMQDRQLQVSKELLEKFEEVEERLSNIELNTIQ